MIDCWAQRSQDTLNQAIDQLPKRLTIPVEAKGGHVEFCPCDGTVNRSIFQGEAVQVDVGHICTAKRHPPFTQYSTRRIVNYLSESESENSCITVIFNAILGVLTIYAK